MYSRRRDTADHHAARCAGRIDAVHSPGRLVAPRCRTRHAASDLRNASPSQVIDVTARIERSQAVGGLINEYREQADDAPSLSSAAA
jgi:hypothetical protein